MNNAQLVNLDSGKTDWRTPKDFFAKLDAEFHFTLDPCSTHENALCEKHYTEEENGLVQEWGGETVFMNPPYSRQTGVWIEKAYRESLKGACVVCLIPARPDASYWHDYILPYATEIRFVRGRLRFSGSSESAPFPSAVVVFGRKMKGMK